ncbi:MAG: hypothetical protein IJJ85_11470 [Clostridia bacterium]|nr:hypothetical protein [Clostridia bacterium]
MFVEQMYYKTNVPVCQGVLLKIGKIFYMGADPVRPARSGASRQGDLCVSRINIPQHMVRVNRFGKSRREASERDRKALFLRFPKERIENIFILL